MSLCYPLVPSSYFQMSLFPHSIGQAYPSSRISSSSSSSIVSLLSARALTGRGLRVTVHQHYGYRLLLTWRKRWGIERRFPTLAVINSFCDELMSLQDIATCILLHRFVDSFLYQKAHLCFNRASRPSHYANCPVTLPSNIRYHICDYILPMKCYCLIQSAPHLVPWFSKHETSDSTSDSD
jgi:hypothetical protein